MCLTLGIVGEDDEAYRVASGAVEAKIDPLFTDNNGPFLNVWFGEQKLFGLIERSAPNDFLQLVCESEGEDTTNGDKSADAGAAAASASKIRVTENISFVLRLSSVPHTTLPPKALQEDHLLNCTQLVLDYAALLKSGMRAQFTGADTDAEYVQFTPE